MYLDSVATDRSSQFLSPMVTTRSTIAISSSAWKPDGVDSAVTYQISANTRAIANSPSKPVQSTTLRPATPRLQPTSPVLDLLTAIFSSCPTTIVGSDPDTAGMRSTPAMDPLLHLLPRSHLLLLLPLLQPLHLTLLLQMCPHTLILLHCALLCSLPWGSTITKTSAPFQVCRSSMHKSHCSQAYALSCFTAQVISQSHGGTHCSVIVSPFCSQHWCYESSLYQSSNLCWLCNKACFCIHLDTVHGMLTDGIVRAAVHHDVGLVIDTRHLFHGHHMPEDPSAHRSAATIGASTSDSANTTTAVALYAIPGKLRLLVQSRVML